MQRPLQAQGWVRRPRANQSTAQQLAEETQHVPIILSRTLEVATAPAPAHQGGQCAPRPKAQPLPVPLVAYHENGCLGCARRPVGQMGMRSLVPGAPWLENFPNGYIQSGASFVARYPSKHQTLVARRPLHGQRPGLAGLKPGSRRWKSPPVPLPQKPIQIGKCSPPPSPPAASPPGLCDALPQRLHVVKAVWAADVVDQNEGVCVLQAPVLMVRPLLGVRGWVCWSSLPTLPHPNLLQGP